MRRLALCSFMLVLTLGLVICAPAAAAEGPVLAARHAGVVTASVVRFRSDYVLRSGATSTLDLAFPLPEGTTLDSSTEAEAIERAGRIVGLRFVPFGASTRHVIVAFAEPLDRRGSAARIAAPLASGDAVQIVEVTGEDDLRFEPDASTRIDRHVGFFAPTELAPSARDACDRAVGYVRLRTIDDPLYVQVTPQIVDEEGIRGTLSSRSDRGRIGALGAASVFIGLVVGLVLLQRRLTRTARIEHAERTLAAEFERLDREAR
jgi:hypothetical protein